MPNIPPPPPPFNMDEFLLRFYLGHFDKHIALIQGAINKRKKILDAIGVVTLTPAAKAKLFPTKRAKKKLTQ